MKLDLFFHIQEIVVQKSIGPYLLLWRTIFDTLSVLYCGWLQILCHICNAGHLLFLTQTPKNMAQMVEFR